MTVLTRDEAQTRAQTLEVHRYTVHLDLTRGEDTFDSRTVISFDVRTGPGTRTAPADTFVEIKPARLRTALLDGKPIDPALLDDNRLPLTGLAPGTHELTVDAAMRYSRTGEGLHRFTDPADGETYVYTQLFLDDVQRLFAAFDQPDLKALFDVSVTAPEGWSVLANTLTNHDGNGNWQAATTLPLPTYLVAVAAGPWHSVHTEHRGLPFGLHCRRSMAPYLEADTEELFALTRACYDRYHEKFDEPYPFDSYDQAFVPEFNAGAMENPGLVTFRDEFLFRSAVTDTERQTRGMVVAHEMAHMWFGDLVTLRWWDDIWLNESFAEYMGYQVLAEATRWKGTWTDFAIQRKAWGYDADQRPTTHPVAPAPDAVPDTASALLNFDGISYAKGASALRQLVHWLGEEDFLAGINAHFARHKFGNATLADFLDNLAAHTERDVHDWARSWLQTTGADTLTAALGEESPRNTRLTLTRDGERPHRVNVGIYDHDPSGAGHLVLRERFDTDVPAEPRELGPRPALVVVNDHDFGYAKVRLDETSHRAVTTALSQLPDALTRAVVWNSLRDAVRDGELAPAVYLEAARTHLPHERDLAVVSGVLTFAGRHIADLYLPAEERPAALALLADLCRDLLRRTEDGSNPGLRLLAVRHSIDNAVHPDIIRDWYDASGVPGGPELDPELRWRILARLCVLGAVDDAVVEAELVQDPSATGQEGAARCRAALPDPAAKQAAWAALFEQDELSNYLFTATAQGFWQPEQAGLLSPYTARYFQDAPDVARRRGPAIGIAVGRYAFPTHTVDQETARQAREALTGDDLTPALRRQLTDRLDDLERALRVRGD